MVACSWTHHFRVENASDGPAEVRYKLSCTDLKCFFADSALIVDGAMRKVYRMDLSDSTISFVLQPGATADLATVWNTTYALSLERRNDALRKKNLVWMRVSTVETTVTYSAEELLEAAAVDKTGLTLLRIR
jgi:hypothetical protein